MNIVAVVVVFQRPHLCKLQKTLVMMLRNWNLCLKPLFSEWVAVKPVAFADIHEGEIVVDIGSGGGIDVFLSANKVKDSGKVFGIDMTDEMLEKARNNAKQSGFTNVEFKKGDIERGIPLEDSTADVVISNCVINLTLDKVAAFKEIYRILRSNGRMVISDLVTSKEVGLDSANSEDWCSCIDGALTKENYIDSIRKAGFNNIEISQEKPYIERDGRKITSPSHKSSKVMKI